MAVFTDEETLTRSEMMERLVLKDRMHFMAAYIEPALVAGLIEMTIPEKPNSRFQKYRLVKDKT
ncbi:MAG: hypothetical protein HKM05_00895 [Spirochaetales bacterium]|nr:hypothetical protein [Spirochaetales bacterium]